jgi:DNA repair protein RadD
MICPDCGHVFPQKDKHEDTASEADILSKWKKPIEYTVESVNYSRHQKAGKPDSLRVEYVCDQYGIIKVSEWICVQHQGFARKKAEKWLKRVTDMEINTVEEALKVCSMFEKPIKIIVDSNGHYPSITARIFAPKKSMEQIKKEKEAETQEALERVMW